MSLRRIAELRRGKRTRALRSSRAIRDRDLPRVMHSKSGGLLNEPVSGSKASIFVRKTLQVRLRDQQCVCIAKLAGKDLRFSMKMMCAPVLELRCSPS